MKILHVIPSMDPQQGGVCQAVKTMIAGLSEKNTKNVVVTMDNPEEGFLKNSPFKIYALGQGKGPWCYNSQLSIWFLTHLVNFDVVMMHGLWLYPGYALHKALEKLKRISYRKTPKLLVMPHGMLDPYFQRAADRKLKALRNTLYWKFIEGSLVNSADALLFTCDEEASLAQEPFKPYHPKQQFVVGLGVAQPPPFTTAMEHSFNERCAGLNGAPYLLFLSRLHQKKGVELLIEAYCKHCEQNITQDTCLAPLPKLVIAGPGLDTTYGKQMQELASSYHQVNQSVFFAGMLTGDAKWGAFYGCEAFILPSHQENFGIAVVEALACGKPVLISDQVNIWKDILMHGGCYVAASSLKGVSELFKYWTGTSPGIKKLMSDNALSIYEEVFSIKPSTNRLLQAIQDIARHHG